MEINFDKAQSKDKHEDNVGSVMEGSNFMEEFFQQVFIFDLFILGIVHISNDQ
jgi:hypothetical protein